MSRRIDIAATSLSAAQRAALAEANAISQEAVRRYREGAIGSAIALTEQVLVAYDRVLGPDHPQVATSLDNLGRLYQLHGAPAKAEPLLERALRIRERLLSAKHPDVASSLRDLAALYRAQARYAQAEPLLERALAICEDMPGAEPAQLAALLNDLALVRDVTAELARTPPPDDTVDVEDALDDAGLTFAGADDADACLTAREIAAIDLHDTRLVVLRPATRGSARWPGARGSTDCGARSPSRAPRPRSSVYGRSMTMRRAS